MTRSGGRVVHRAPLGKFLPKAVGAEVASSVRRPVLRYREALLARLLRRYPCQQAVETFTPLSGRLPSSPASGRDARMRAPGRMISIPPVLSQPVWRGRTSTSLPYPHSGDAVARQAVLGSWGRWRHVALSARVGRRPAAISASLGSSSDGQLTFAQAGVT